MAAADENRTRPPGFPPGAPFLKTKRSEREGHATLLNDSYLPRVANQSGKSQPWHSATLGSQRGTETPCASGGDRVMNMPGGPELLIIASVVFWIVILVRVIVRR